MQPLNLEVNTGCSLSVEPTFGKTFIFGVPTNSFLFSQRLSRDCRTDKVPIRQLITTVVKKDLAVNFQNHCQFRHLEIKCDDTEIKSTYLNL